MFAEYLVAKALLALTTLPCSTETTVFVGRLGLAQREIWHLSSSRDPVCIAHFPIQNDLKSWKGLKIAVNPIKDEILVVESVDEEMPDPAHLIWHFRVRLQRLSYSGKLLGKYKFECSNTDDYGFGFTATGHPFAAYLSENEEQAKVISLDGTPPVYEMSTLHGLLLWKYFSSSFAELLREHDSLPFRGEIIPKLGDDVVNVTSSAIYVNGEKLFSLPRGIREFMYASEFKGGVYAVAAEAVEAGTPNTTLGMTVYRFSFGSKTFQRGFDGAYVVVAKAGSLPVRHSR